MKKGNNAERKKLQHNKSDSINMKCNRMDERAMVVDLRWRLCFWQWWQQQW